MKIPMTKLFLISTIIITIFVYFYLDLNTYLTMQNFTKNKFKLLFFYENNPRIFILLFSLIYIFSVTISLPIASVLTLFSGFLFGFELGIVIVSFSSSIGALLAFIIIRLLFYNYFQNKYRKEFYKFNQAFKKEGSYYIFALRLIPTFPFFLVNAFSALLPIKMWTYFWVSFIGMLPGTILYVNAGKQLSLINQIDDIISMKIFISFCLIGILPIMLKFCLKKIILLRNSQ